MSAKIKPVTLEITLPVSNRDAAYKFARTGETASVIARYVMDNNPSFPEEVSKELKTELSSGFQLRYQELKGDTYYRLSEDKSHYINLGNSIELKNAQPAGTDKIINVNVAYGYSQQAFGQLKNTDKALYDVLSPVRTAFSKYVSNNLKGLQTAARGLVAPTEKKRGATNNFNIALETMFKAYDIRVINANNRGDVTAIPAKYRTAVNAFWNSYNA
jgi:hypothetical protein